MANLIYFISNHDLYLLQLQTFDHLMLEYIVSRFEGHFESKQHLEEKSVLFEMHFSEIGVNPAIANTLFASDKHS